LPVVLPDERERLIAVSDAAGDRGIDRIGQMGLDAEHVVFGTRTTPSSSSRPTLSAYAFDRSVSVIASPRSDPGP